MPTRTMSFRLLALSLSILFTTVFTLPQATTAQRADEQSASNAVVQDRTAKPRSQQEQLPLTAQPDGVDVNVGRARLGGILESLTVNPFAPKAFQPTNFLVPITCNGAGGAWSSAATWNGGVPTNADIVTIGSGCTVTIDTASAVAQSVTIQSGGVLIYDATLVSTLTVGGSVTIDSGGIFQSAASGTVTTHVLSLGGSLTNNGTLDFSTNGNTAGAGITFTTAGNATFGGSGATTNIRTLTVNKGTSYANILDLNPTNFSVQGSTVDGAWMAFATLTNGTLRIAGTFTMTSRVFTTAAYSIPGTAGIWLNNPNFSVAGQNASPTSGGLLRLTNGTYNVGLSSGNSMAGAITSVFIIEGGNFNTTGRFLIGSATAIYSQTGGSMNVCTIGNASSSNGSFGVTSASAFFNMSGGSINLIQASTATTPLDYQVSAAAFITGGVLNVGNTTTATNFLFRIQGQMPNVVLDTTTNNKNANLSAQGNVWGNLTIPSGTTLNLNSQTLLMIGPSITNNGAISVTTTNTGSVNFAGGLQTAIPNYAQTYTGTGTVGAPALRLASFAIQSPLGVTISPSASTFNVYRANLFYGAVTNSDKLQIGGADATAVVIQRGATGIAFPVGSFDIAPTFNVGAGGLILVYSQGQANIATGPEIPASRSVLGFQVINPLGVTLAGGPLTATGTGTGSAGLLLSSGVLTTTNSNLLTLTGAATGAVSGGSAASFVNGPLERTLPASLASGSTYTMPVGKGSFKMFELVNPTTNAGGTAVVRAEVFDTNSGGTPGTGFSALNSNRYWAASVTSGGANFTNTTVRVTEQGTGAFSAIGQSASQGGAYENIGGTTTAPTIGPSTATSFLGFFAVGTATGASTISGPATVGAGGTYATVTAAIADLNSKVMTGPVTITLTDATYPTETFPIIIQPNAGASATNTLTIKPGAGVAPVLTGSSATALIVINGADYVTIDGSNTVGGTTRDMSLTNTNTGTASAVIWGQTVGTGDPATNNTIKNLNLTGNLGTTTLAGVGFGSSTISAATVGTRNDNNRIQNNNIAAAQFGVISQGASSTNKNFGTVITGNILGGASSLALGRAGVYVGFEDGVQVTNNVVNGVGTSASADGFGIALGSISIASTGFTTNNDVANPVVTGNTIGSVVKTDTFSGVGISLGTTNYGTSLIANNFIYGVVANPTPSDLCVGIYVGSAGTTYATTQVYYNSVSMTGSRDTGGNSTMPSFAFAVFGANPIVDARNNIFSNSQTATNGTTTAGSYAIGLTSAAPFTNLTSNYNDLYSTGTASHFAITGSLTNLPYDLPNLSAWQVTTGKDINSISADPLYTSLTDLHILPGSPALNAGTPIAGVTVDIDGQTRPQGPAPEIGADEVFVATPGTLAFSSPTYSVGENDGSVTLTVSRTGGSNGAVSVDYALGSGTATGGGSCGGSVDYVNIGGTVNLADAETSKTFNVTICNDFSFEGNETFNATLSNATGGATIGSPNPATVTITEDKLQPTVAFSSATYSTTDELGQVSAGAFITVNLSGPSASTVSVNYATVAGGTATGGASCTPGVDYINTSGTLNFSPGVTSLSFSVPPCFDSVDEPDETFNLALSSPVNTTLGTPNTAVVTIIDNDVPSGPVGVTASAGTTSAAYNTLKEAFDAINAGTHQGVIAIAINANLTETATAVLNNSGAGSASYTSVSIAPAGGARVIEGTIVGAVVKLNGADNVTIDGRIAGTGRNLTIRNNSTAAATAALWLSSVAVGNGASNNVIRNLEIAAGQTANAGTNTTIGILMSGATVSVTSDGNDNDNNQFLANRVTRARYGIVTRGVAANNNEGLVIADNIVGPNSFGADEIGKVGIFVQQDNAAIVTRNTVQFVGGDTANTTAGADRCGICIGGESWSVTDSVVLTSGGYQITRNTIHDIIEERTFSSIGIRLGTTRGGSVATNNLVANNFIYNVRADATSGDQVAGIGVSNGHTDSIVFNSISITGDQDPGASALSTTYGNAIRITQANGTNNANFTVANNSIYLDASSSTAAQRYYAITLNVNSYSFGTGFLNRNNYYINGANTQVQTGGLITTGTGSAATTQFATLANWQTALTAPQDANSIQANPLFVSPTADLHIVGASPNVDAGVAAASVTDDIEGQSRPNGAGFDIGADEFYALPGTLALSSTNYGGNEGNNLSVTVNRSLGSSGTVAVTATLTNGTATGGAVCGAGVDFVNPGPQAVTFNDGVTSQSFNVQLCTDVAVDPNETFSITLSNPTNGAVLGSPSSATATITDVPPPFSGSYDIGPGQTYTSLTNSGGIFEALNLSGATGNVTLNIIADLSGETGTFALNELAGGFSVTIKPSGASRTITGSSTNSIIRLNGADNVTIDGSLAGGTATGIGGTPSLRNLTVQNTNTTATAGSVIAVMQGPNSANNVTIKNVNVMGQDPTQTLIGIHVGGNSTGTSPTTSNTNVVIDNCSFKRSFIAIFNNGATTPTATGSVISHNDLSATGADRMRRAGIFFFNQNGIQVTENAIGGIVGDESADAIGIIAGIQDVNATNVTNGGVTNAVIAKNRISGIASTNTTGFSAVGIAIAGGTTGENFIGNNMISGAIAPSTSPDFVAGIFVAGVSGSNTHLFYNSISNTGARGAVASQIGSYGVAISGSNPVVELKDNIFYNTQTSGGGANAKTYAIGMTSTTFTNLSSNYNDFFTSGANAAGFRTGSLDTTGTDLADIAAWRTATSGDANSIAADPLFTDTATNLHIATGSPVINVGTVIGLINDDIDGDPRGATPDMGADEFVSQSGTLAFSSATYSVGEAGPNVTLTVNRTGGSTGAVSVDYALAGGTATGGASCAVGVDYINTGGTVNFADAETTKTFNVAICNDNVFEGDETFNATLSNATGGATIGTPNPAAVTITDNELQPTVQFSSATYSTTDELNLGTGAVITVNLSGPSASTVSVNYATVAGGTATGGASCTTGVDYVNASGTLTFNPGQTSRTFAVQTCIDNVDEPDETVNLALSSPVNTTLGVPNTAVLTIIDNDAPAGGPVTVTASAGTPGPTNYPTLKDAIDAINAGTHQGNITVSIVTNTTETATSVLNSGDAAPASYTSIVIRPVNDGLTVAGPSLQGRGLIELNGADNVTIDGDNPNSGGTNRNLTIQNTAANTVTFTSVIRVALNTTNVTTGDNNSFKNLVLLGSSTGRNIAAATSTTASENTTFGVLVGLGASAPTTAPAAITSVSTGIAAPGTTTNLLISNNDVRTAARAISVNGTATTVATGLVISNNSIGNPTAGNADQVTSVGITASGSTNAVISGNTVWVEGFVGSSAAGHGIAVGVNSTAISGTTVEKNTVNRVRNSNPATFAAYGITLSGGANHIVQNNFVSGVMNDQTAGTGAFNTTFGAIGIRISSGTGHKVYHNSVNLYGPLAGTTSTDLTAAFGVAATGQTGMDVRNNIFSNQVAGGNPAGTRNVPVFLPSGATSAMNLTWNNNAYYAGTDALNRLAQVGTTFGAGEYQVTDFDPTQTTPATNFRAYTSTLSAAGTNDNASFAQSGAAPFTSNVDLHIPAATATRLESGGAAVGVTTDIDADARNATTPDIGADEFAGTPAPANDMAATAFINPTNGSTISTGVSFAPQARFLNLGTATQTSVTVRFKIIDASLTTIYNQTATIPTIAPLQQVVVSFPSTSIAVAGAYTMQAAAELAGDQNTSNDIINGAFNAISPFGGTISVGTGQTYTSLTNAGGLFQNLNSVGLSGNLTVNITSDLTTETGAVMLNQLTETGPGGYTVTFKPSGGARTISGTSAASVGLITLNGADRIVFDGSTSGGTDRSLTITNNSTTGVVMWIRSAAAGNGATNNTVKNCILNGAPGPNSATIAGILTGSGVTLGNDAEAPNSNNTIQNNAIYRVQNSLYLRGGTVAANFDQNWVVTGNDLGSANANDNNVFRGMLIGNAQNFTITNNNVQGVRSTTTTTVAMSGIQLALLVNGGTVTGNKITNIKNTSASGTGAFGFQFSTSSTGSNVTVANNFVSDVAATGSATITSNGFGMSFNGSGTGYNVYFNSVNMNTDQGSAQTSAALFVNSTFATAGALNVRNNVFSNTQTTGARYAVYSTAAASVFTAINYNDYSAPAVGFIGGSARNTLADWQGATGQDANSLAVNPLFVSATDLHLQAASTLRNAGVAGTGITTDIDNETRDANPDIGADELPALVTPGTLQFSNATYSGGEAGSPFTVTVTRTNGTSGTVTVNYATSNGTATGGASCTPGVDYVSTNGTLTFLDGETSKTFNVTICNDAIDEPDETINYTLSSPTGGAVLGTPSTAVQTIVDDDVAPGVFSISDVRSFEGNAGAVNFQFTVTFGGSSAPASVQYSTANGTATSGVDFLPASGTLNFNGAAPGPEGLPPSSSQTVTVVVNSDVAKEANETFFVNLSNPVNGSITDGTGVGIIIDEDRAYVADFDRDRSADASVWRPSEGRWYVLQSATATARIVTFGNSEDIAVPGDYDGDGIADIGLWRPSTGQWFRILSSDSSTLTTSWGTSGDKPVQGDYDGDGKTDLAVFRPSTGTWWIVNSSNGSTTATPFGISTDRIVQGDYDGDAKTDRAVYRDGTWYISRSSDNSVQISNWGLAADKPVAGDFDGDGSYDLAVYRNGAWWVRQSLTGTTSVIALGLSTDLPTPADYDGDGTTDKAVFRPSTGDWYILRSSNGTVMGPHWGVSGDVLIPAAYIPQ